MSAREAGGPTLVLTPQELTVLEQAHAREAGSAGHDELTAGPAGSALEAQAEGQRSQARWSLLARGLLTPQGGLPEDTDLGLLVRTVLDVRLAARSLVVVERLLGQGRRDLRLLHLLPRGGVVEDLHPEGLHGLDLALTPEELVEAVTTMVVPPDAQPGRGQQIVLDGGTDAAHLPVLLRGPTVLAELTLTGPGQGEAAVPPSGEPAVPPPGEAAGAPCDGAHLVALGPGGCWAGPRPAGPRPLRLSPVPPGWVGELVGAWVRATVLPAGGTMAP